MKPVSSDVIKERGWFYKDNAKYFFRICDFCKNEYIGQGLQFCSYKCSRFANPIIMNGEDNASWKGGKPKCTICNINTIHNKKCKFCKSCKFEKRKIAMNENKSLCPMYKNWMLTVKKRDGWKCRIADVNCDGRLEAHHILNWIDYPELRYEINNGITLCQKHHPRGRVKESSMVNYFTQIILEPSV